MNPHHRSPRVATALLAALLCVLSACSASGGEAPATSGTSGGSGVAGASSAPASDLQYVALGDSYSSAPLVPTTDVADGCFRSSNNYPSLVAQALGATLEDRTCGGARSKDFTAPQYPAVPPQLSALSKDTDVVTIGTGGNDESVFQQLTTRCPALRAQDPTGSPCQEFMESGGQDRLLAALDRTRERLTTLVGRIEQAAPDAQVLVVGYPQIIDADEQCAELPLAGGDYAYAEKVNRALTDALASAARANGATYVDVWAASQGHSVCSQDPWINGSVNDEKRAARFHPFAEEQQAVAGLVEQAIAG